MVDSAEVRIGTQGRLVLPRAVRDELGAEEGSVYVARVEDGALVLEPRERILARLREHATGGPAAESSWVGELLDERRRAARQEEAGE